MNQKNENQLNLALMLTEDVRELTDDLNTGYDSEEKEWELIVRFSNEITDAARAIAIRIKELSQGFALVTIKESLIDTLANLAEVIFLEKPRKLYTGRDYGKVAACISGVSTPPLNLSGEGVLVGIIDTGIDPMHPEFFDSNGKSRILWIYDETTGREYNNFQIEEGNALISDVSGHGTHVAGIAAGNNGVANKSQLIVVTLGEDDYFNTARLMEAVDYVIKKAEELKKPVAINLSIGNNYGAHSGDSLLENYLNNMVLTWKTVIVAGVGNEADKNIHVSGKITSKKAVTELVIGENESSLDVQLWQKYGDIFEVSIIAPDGNRFGPIGMETFERYVYGNTEIYVYTGEPKPYSTDVEILIQFISVDNTLDSGIWQFEISPVKIQSGEYDLWLPAGNFVNNSTGFSKNSPETTLTIPSTAYNVISVGAYNQRTNSYAAFSGRGFTRKITTVKPDLVAPGVNIVSAAPGGRYVTRTGTSMAAPFVTGSAALLMEWGVVRGNDPFMYGEKVKAYLIKGAKPLPGETVPSIKTGWGALCLGGAFEN